MWIRGEGRSGEARGSRNAYLTLTVGADPLQGTAGGRGSAAARPRGSGNTAGDTPGARSYGNQSMRKPAVVLNVARLQNGALFR